jgi:hypothetical protein
MYMARRREAARENVMKGGSDIAIECILSRGAEDTKTRIEIRTAKMFLPAER